MCSRAADLPLILRRTETRKHGLSPPAARGGDARHRQAPAAAAADRHHRPSPRLRSRGRQGAAPDSLPILFSVLSE